jgi:hypothetical protein
MFKEEQRLRVIDSRVRRRMLGPKRDAEIREGRYLHMRIFIIFILFQVLLE